MSESALIGICLVFVAIVVFVVMAQNNKSTQKAMNDAVNASHPQFNPTKKILNDYGRWTIFIDEKSQLLLMCTRGGIEWKVYDFRQLIRSEVIEDGNTVTSTVRSSQIIGAVVGKVLVGGAGLLIGGLTGKSRSKSEISKVSLSVTVSDTAHALWSLPIMNEKKPVLRSKAAAQAALCRANEAHAMISALIRLADEAEKAKQIQVQVSTPPQLDPPPKSAIRASFAEEFIKLSKLRDQGILSDVEFAEMKVALIAEAKKGA